MSHMSTTGVVTAAGAVPSTAANAATDISGAMPIAAPRGPESALGGAEGIGCIKGIDGCAEGSDSGGGGGDGGAGVRLRDFWAALNVVRPASLVGHSVGMWEGEAGQQVRLSGRLEEVVLLLS